MATTTTVGTTPRPVRRVPVAAAAWAWAVLGTVAVLALALPRFLPFYDLGEWVLQARIVHDLVVGGPAGPAGPAGQLYAWAPAPVPNLAAPAAIAGLAMLMPVDAAARVFLILGVLGFAAGYAVLVRRVQGHATVAEFTGLVWALGYFLQRGYVSYLFALPVAFVGVAVLHPVLRGPVSRRRLAGVAALGVLAYLAHLVGWTVLAVTVGGYAVVLWRRHRRRRDALAVAATLLPAAGLLLWYALARPGGGHLAWYSSMRDKALSLGEALHLFLRLDPFPGVVPVFAAQVAVGLALLLLLATALRRGSRREWLGSPVLLGGLVLAALAVLDPVGNLDALTKPDQRLLFPAVLLVVAAMPTRVRTRRSSAAAAGIVAASLALHALAWTSLDAPLGAVSDALDRTVPAGAAVTTVAVPPAGGCAPATGPTIGIPALKWFDVQRQVRLGQLRADLQETSAVALRFDPRTGPTLRTLTPAAAQAADAVRAAGPADYVEVFACAPDRARVARDLAASYRTVASGPGYAILRRLP